MARTIQRRGGQHTACAICSDPPVEYFAGFDFCQSHLSRIRVIAAAAGRLPSPLLPSGASMPNDVQHNRRCSVCGELVERQSSRGPWPRVHPDCKGKKPKRAAKPSPAPAEDPAESVEDEATPVEAHEVLDLIDQWNLDFNLGNVVRFILEREDGSPRENLENCPHVPQPRDCAPRRRMRSRVVLLGAALALGCATPTAAPPASAPVENITTEQHVANAADALNFWIREYVEMGGRVEVSSGNVPPGEKGVPVVIVTLRGIPHSISY